MHHEQNKRRHNFKQQEITDETLLNSNFLLLNREYYAYSTGLFSDYKNQFIGSKLKHFFDKNHEKNYFKDFYLKNCDNERFIDNYNTFITRKDEFQDLNLDSESIDFKCVPYAMNNISVKNIQDFIPTDELNNLVQKCPGFVDFNVSLTYHKQNFIRTGIISLSDDTDVFSSIDFLKSDNVYSLHFSPLIFSRLFFSRTDLHSISHDIKYLQKLIAVFFERYGINEPVPDGNVDFYILLLRCVFNYCYYCTVQFSNHIEMVKCCGDYHIRTGKKDSRGVFDRKNKVLTEAIDYNYIKTSYGKGYINCLQKESGEFQCKVCNKEFESVNYFLIHFEKKHEVDLEVEKWNVFVDNIDFFLMSYVLGTSSWNLPWFVRNLNIDYTYVNETVYDMGKVFSGDLSK